MKVLGMIFVLMSSLVGFIFSYQVAYQAISKFLRGDAGRPVIVAQTATTVRTPH